MRADGWDGWVTTLTTPILEAGAEPRGLKGPAQGLAAPRHWSCWPEVWPSGPSPAARLLASGHRSPPWTVLLGSHSRLQGARSGWIWPKALPALRQVHIGDCGLARGQGRVLQLGTGWGGVGVMSLGGLLLTARAVVEGAAGTCRPRQRVAGSQKERGCPTASTCGCREMEAGAQRSGRRVVLSSPPPTPPAAGRRSGPSGV